MQGGRTVFLGRGPRWRSGNDHGANGDESDVDLGLDQHHFSTETTSARTSESDQAMSRYEFSSDIQLSGFAIQADHAGPLQPMTSDAAVTYVIAVPHTT